MEVICRLQESTLDINPDNELIVESDMWPAKDVILRLKDASIKVNAESLKQAIDNCCNI